MREVRTTTKVDKRSRPVMQKEMSENDWRFSQSEWQDYTRATGVTGQHLLEELRSCMSAFRRLAFNQGSKEDKMLERIKSLAVSVLHATVHTMALHESRQSSGAWRSWSCLGVPVVDVVVEEEDVFGGGGTEDTGAVAVSAGLELCSVPPGGGGGHMRQG